MIKVFRHIDVLRPFLRLLFHVLRADQIRHVVDQLDDERLWHPTFVHFGLGFEYHTKVVYDVFSKIIFLLLGGNDHAIVTSRCFKQVLVTSIVS